MDTLVKKIYEIVDASNRDIRVGQALFNLLPGWAANRVASTLFDPFHKNFTDYELYTWINNHLIFDGDEIIAVFNNDTILAERP